ncbi:MAG: hypothetical protein H0X65_03680 [Gemmatimonadetes bacterium]|nr:hypothetical protein [Gemmatimonadota bacterium]
MWIALSAKEDFSPSGTVQFDKNDGGPPHKAINLFIAGWIVDHYVSNGGLRKTLYHEGAHLMGVYDENDAAIFEDTCSEEERDVEEREEIRYESGGGGGGDCIGCIEEPDFTACVWRIIYYVDIGEIIHAYRLYCY